MKLGITGLPQAGKTTVFEALTGSISETGNRSENRIGTIRVPDPRVDTLSRMYNPKKTIYAQVEYLLPALSGQGKEGRRDPASWNMVRDCDAIIHVVRNFGGYGLPQPCPAKDVQHLDQELILSDLVVVEKRLERIEADGKRGKKIDAEELSLLNACHHHLESELPLRGFPEICAAPTLRGFALLSAKPMLVLLNNADEDDQPPSDPALLAQHDTMVIRGKLEHELAQMTREEAEAFLAEFSISESATDRVIKRSYELLGLVSFFTVGEDEVRAWTIKKETPAVDAADVIHSDIKKGFIRAEVLAYEDLMRAASYAEARKQGTVRLEGKTYRVIDGDIINFRFNV